MIASGIHFFLLPSKLSLGGATGMALVLSKYLPLSTGALLVVVNIFLFALGFLIMGFQEPYGFWKSLFHCRDRL